MVKLIELIDLSEFYKCWVFLLVQDILGGRSNQSRVANVSVKLTKKTNHLKQVISYMHSPFSLQYVILLWVIDFYVNH